MDFRLFTRPARYLAGKEDKRRLETFAPLFDITFTQVDNSVYELLVHDEKGLRKARIPAQRAHDRLLAELCEKVLHWMYFHAGEHCGITLLSHPDSKVRRIAELYAIRKSALAGHKEKSPNQRHGDFQS